MATTVIFKTLSVISTVLLVNSRVIEYKFSKNYGQIFYDYSGNQFHGVNGQSISTSSYDTKATDRGAYFSGTSSILLPPNEISNTQFTLVAPFSILFWLYNTDTSFTLFSRISSDPTFFLNIQRESVSNLIFGQANLNGPQLMMDDSYPSNIWCLVTALIYETDINIYINNANVFSYTYTVTKYFESGSYITNIGDNLSGPVMFLWYFLIINQDITPSDYISLGSMNCLTISGSCTCADNMCDTAFLDPDKGFGVMSSFTDPNQDALGISCDPSTYGCSGIIQLDCQCDTQSCIFTAGDNNCQCVELADGKITTGMCACETGYRDKGDKCCDTSCSSCASNSPDICITCVSANAIPGLVGCDCVDGYFGAHPLQLSNSCSICYSECKTCSFFDTCIDCVATFATANVGGGGCACNNGYQGTSPLNAIGSCYTCHPECLSCSTSLICTLCKATLGIPHVISGCYCPIGTYTQGSPLIASNSCMQCYQECFDCVSANICTSCISANSSPTSIQGCKCDAGFYSNSFLVALDSCKPCHLDCSACVYADQCSACKDQNSFPSDLIGCTCKAGFYKDETSSCQPCSMPCRTCSSVKVCLTCIDDNSEIGAEYCKCKEGFYNTTEGVCKPCPDNCNDCNNESCKVCEVKFSFLDNEGKCACPANSSFVGNSCQCKEQYYMDSDLSTNICKSCHHTCKTCSNSTVCETCFGRKAIDPDTKLCALKCKSSQVVLNDECCDCPSLCDSCNKTFYCTQCSENAYKVELACKCKAGYENINNKCTSKYFWPRLTINPDNRLMIDFTVSLINLLSFEDFHIKIGTKASYSISFVQKSISIYYFILSFTENLQSGSLVLVTILQNPLYGIDNSVLGNYTLEGELKDFIYITAQAQALTASTAAATKTAVAASISMAIVSNPAAAWTLINTIQLIKYMPINANPLTPTLCEFFRSIGEYNIIPNVMEFIFDSNSSAEPYRNAQTIGLNTSVFWVNFGPTATVLLFFVAAWPFIYLISKVKVGRIATKFAKFLGNYRYSIFLRFLIQAYLDIGFYSLIQLKADIIKPVHGFINAVSAVIGIICTMLTPPVLLVCSYISKGNIFDTSDPQYSKRFGSLFEEFKNNKGFFSSLYYTLYFLRRLVFLLVQVYLNNYPHLQAGLNISFTIIALAFLIYYRPFKEPHILISTFASEICVISVFSISSGFLYDISSYSKSILESAIVLSVLGGMGIQFLVSVYSLILSLKYTWSKIEKLRSKSFLDQTQIKASGRYF